MFVPLRMLGRTILASLYLAVIVSGYSISAEETGSFVCAVKGIPIPVVGKTTQYSAYRGARYYFCSAKYKSVFLENPAKYASEAAKSSGVKAAFLFDPVSTRRLNADKAFTHSDYQGIRFFFSSAADKETFDKSPQKYGVLPKKDALFCPVANLPVGNYGNASDYSDTGGVRYFFCCAGCKEKFDSNPAKHLEGYEEKLKKHHLKISDDSEPTQKSDDAK